MILTAQSPENQLLTLTIVIRPTVSTRLVLETQEFGFPFYYWSSHLSANHLGEANANIALDLQSGEISQLIYAEKDIR